MNGPYLYARSRTLPLTVAMLVATAGLAVWAADALDAYLDPQRRVPLVALAPLAAAAVIGASLHTPSDELDRAAVRPWWRSRLTHLLSLTAVAAALLPWAVLGHDSFFGPPVMIRNTLGCVGLTAAAAVVLGARLSWLPIFGYVSAVFLGSAGLNGSAIPLWAWLVQPSGQKDGWLLSLVVYVGGGALYLFRGARAEQGRD